MPSDNELRLPGESITTLHMAFTKEVGKQALGLVKRLTADGLPEESVLGRLRVQMRGFSEHTVQRLYDIGVGRAIRDDLSKEDIAKMKATAKDTFELLLKKPPRKLGVGSVIRFMGTDWFVKRIYGIELCIRRMV